MSILFEGTCARMEFNRNVDFGKKSGDLTKKNGISLPRIEFEPQKLVLNQEKNRIQSPGF